MYPGRMKAVVIRHPGKGIEAWQLIDRPDPEPGPGQVLVRVRAAALNYRDLLVAHGRYGGPLKPDLVPLADGVGDVVAVGAGVTRWQRGDRVAGAYFQTWQAGPMRAEYFHHSGGTHATEGMLAQYAVLPETGVVRIPAYLSYEQAATLPCAAVTAWAALMEPAPRWAPGATVVVLGTGGVSIFVAQLAIAAGLRVIATSSSEAKIMRLRELGVTDVINYRTTPEWPQQVARLTDGEGADHVVDVGGAGTLPRSFEAVKVGGVVSLIGLLAGLDIAIDPMPVLFKSIRLEGLTVGSVTMFEALNRMLARTRVVPVVDEVFPLERASAALSKMAAATHYGKIVIRIDD